MQPAPALTSHAPTGPARPARASAPAGAAWLLGQPNHHPGPALPNQPDQQDCEGLTSAGIGLSLRAIQLAARQQVRAPPGGDQPAPRPCLNPPASAQQISPTLGPIPSDPGGPTSLSPPFRLPQNFTSGAPPVPCTMARNGSLIFRWYSGSMPAGKQWERGGPGATAWCGICLCRKLPDPINKHELCDRLPRCCLKPVPTRPPLLPSPTPHPLPTHPPPAGLLTATDCGQMTGDSVVTILSSPAPAGPFSCEG